MDYTPFRLLALCARAEAHPEQLARLARQAAVYPDWEALPAAAERHGLAPLAFKHLTAAGAPWPAAVRRTLQAQAVRARYANAARFQALGEILRAFTAAGLRVLVLKGAALAHLVYPDPALRPMDDLDLLVEPAQAEAAHAQLAALGFRALDYRLPADHHHRPPLAREVDGVSVVVELHTALLYPRLKRPPLGLNALWPAAQTFTVEDTPAYTLGRLDMLAHLYQHGFHAHLRFNRHRLIWAADLISAVEAWGPALDWPALGAREPALPGLLAQLDDLTPWPPALAAVLRPAAEPAWRTWWRRGFPPEWRLVLQYEHRGLPGLFRHWTN